jgi:transcriptional regulator with XRE-family HTH domain
MERQHPIERWRRARGLRQADLAQKLGTHVNTVAKWENGARPRARWMPALAEVLGVEAAQLEAELASWQPSLNGAATPER